MPVVVGGPSTTISPKIASDIIAETKRHLFSGQREQRNRLASAVDATATTWTFKYDLGGIQAGAILCTELELVYVWEATPASKTAIVERGLLGSKQVAHDTNVACEVNPKFYGDFGVMEMVNNEIKALSSEGLYQVKTVDLTFNAATAGYDLAAVTDILDVYRVFSKTPGPEASWPEVKQWSLRRNMRTSDFGSGFGLVLQEPAYPGMEVRVLYKAPFATLGSLSDDVLTVTGLHSEAHDIPALGAAARLTMPREIKRGTTEQQGEPRRASEVPPGTSSSAARNLLAYRNVRVQAEKRRLQQMYPFTRGR